MGYECRIECDSITPMGHRLTTMVVAYPRFVHSELMTARVFSRNAASSRAIPIEKMINQVLVDPAMPVWWGKNQPGMAAREELSTSAIFESKRVWLQARDEAVASVQKLRELGLHKALANRLLEPWMWTTVVVTATEWENFFNLRCHPDAQPEIRVIAEMMREAMANSTPKILLTGEWHLPFTPDLAEMKEAGLPIGNIVKVATGRCARVSYLTHDGKRSLVADMDLHDKLLVSGHMSPFEHCAQVPAYSEHMWWGNFYGWRQYRKTIPGEAVFKGAGH